MSTSSPAELCTLLCSRSDELCFLSDPDSTALARCSSPNDDVLQLAVKTVQMFSLVLATVLLGNVHYA